MCLRLYLRLRLRLTFSFLAAAALACAQAPPAASQVVSRIGMIDFYGLNKVPEDRLRKTLGFTDGDPFPRSKADVEELNRRLRVEKASLRSLARIELEARARLGMVAPTQQQVQLAREFAGDGTASAAADGSFYLFDDSVFNSVLAFQGSLTPNANTGPGRNSKCCSRWEYSASFPRRHFH
jgi:hypothetical protein